MRCHMGTFISQVHKGLYLRFFTSIGSIWAAHRLCYRRDTY